MKTSTVAEKLKQLREQMHQAGIDYYYVPAADEHHNEYLPECWKRRAWISHFTGSAGDVMIGKDCAFLWTDARYFLQARNELDPQYFELLEQIQGTQPPIAEWLKKNAAGKHVGVDPKLISLPQAKHWQNILSQSKGKLVVLENNLIDSIWSNKPSLKTYPISVLNEQFAGKSVETKLAALRQAISTLGADTEVITTLDAIAWLFNIRGRDIEYNPLIISYAIVTQKEAFLFLDKKQLSEKDHDYFKSQNITLKNYSEFQNHLNSLTGSVLLDPHYTNLWTEQQIRKAHIVVGYSPITLMKAIKNPIEVRGMHEAHRRDGIAMCQFLHWLENHWRDKTESSAADQLEKFRREDAHCQGPSFETITGYGDHGAIIHYRVTPETDRKLNNDNLYLIDSGGQYYEGTTDITRTIHLGTPTNLQKHHYTLVLKGHLALRHTVFPDGINGEHLNAIAHIPLWNEALDYSHGTGHGVGSYLCVHEGPHRIALALTGVPLKPNMVVSNEPGLYFEGQYGIRIENLCVIVKKYDIKESASGHGPFYTMQDLTLVPYARNLINKEELTSKEIQWINEYHDEIYKTLANDLPTDAASWLREATRPL